jgi:hypothetical protein
MLSGDAGTSLMELIVGMAVMAIFMAMFTGAVVLMTSAANKVQGVTLSSAQVNQAFLQLDKTVRYASAISTPGTGGAGDWYVELSTPSVGGVATCIQLRDNLTSKQLQKRTWKVTGATPGVVSALSPSWQPVASSIANTVADVPFVLGTNSASLFQQLQISLISSSTQPATATSKTSFTFSALNSTLTPVTVCQQVGRP